MFKREKARSLVMALLVGIAVLGMIPETEAAQQKDPAELISATQKSAAVGWQWLMMAASFVVGGGALASGGRALYKGDWTTGGIGVGFGIGVLLLMWALGSFFDYNDAPTSLYLPANSSTVVSG